MLKYFLGNSPKWFKMIMIIFLIINIPVAIYEPKVAAWMFIGEFIFTLAMALKCYPLQSGGLLAIQILVLRLTHPMYKTHHGKVYYDTEQGHAIKEVLNGQTIFKNEAGNILTGLLKGDYSPVPGGAIHEVEQNLDVILLLMFMVAAIHFMKPLLMYIFSKVFIKVKNKVALSVLFVMISAVLSAFLDALTVTAVLISVAVGFYGVYHKIHSSSSDYDKDGTLDRKELSGETLEKFKSFLRSLVMHGVVGTALGGVCTLVGEPQNLLIGDRMNWDFIQFFLKMAPITLPVLGFGVLTTIILELTGWFGFGEKLPPVASRIIESYTIKQDEKRSKKQKTGLVIQGVSAVLLILGLALHIAPVGFIGLALIIVQTAFMGITEEHQLGHAFEEAMPFTALLVVFFVIVSMIHDQELFKPIIEWALSQPEETQPGLFYLANGFLSAISDNVFVATVYIGEVKSALGGDPTKLKQLERLAIAINTGTNLPSVATPNGQAAFLFLLTSSLAPLINLSYGKMVKMALPYTIVLGGVGYIMVKLML